MRRPPIGKSIALLLLSLWLAFPAGAEQVLVINSKDLNLYNRAVAGIQGSYRIDRGEVVRVVYVADLEAPLAGGPAIPCRRPRIIAPDAPAIPIHQPDIVLGQGMSLFGQRAPLP